MEEDAAPACSPWPAARPARRCRTPGRPWPAVAAGAKGARQFATNAVNGLQAICCRCKFADPQCDTTRAKTWTWFMVHHNMTGSKLRHTLRDVLGLLRALGSSVVCLARLGLRATAGSSAAQYVG